MTSDVFWTKVEKEVRRRVLEDCGGRWKLGWLTARHLEDGIEAGLGLAFLHDAGVDDVALGLAPPRPRLVSEDEGTVVTEYSRFKDAARRGTDRAKNYLKHEAKRAKFERLSMEGAMHLAGAVLVGDGDTTDMAVLDSGADIPVLAKLELLHVATLVEALDHPQRSVIVARYWREAGGEARKPHPLPAGSLEPGCPRDEPERIGRSTPGNSGAGTAPILAQATRRFVSGCMMSAPVVVRQSPMRACDDCGDLKSHLESGRPSHRYREGRRQTDCVVPHLPAAVHAEAGFVTPPVSWLDEPFASAVEALPDRERRVIEALFFDCLTLGDVARDPSFGISPNDRKGVKRLYATKRGERPLIRAAGGVCHSTPQ